MKKQSNLNKYANNGINLFLLFISLLFSTNISATVPTIEREALVALYNSTDGDNWIDNSNWLVGDPCDDEWFGVTCTGSTSVIVVSLSGNNLTGNLPPEIGNLQNLRTLSIYNNQLTGVIPLEFGNLTNLENIWIENNQFSGDIPTNILSLKQFRAEKNYFENIPSSIGNMINLERIQLHFNNISSIPEEIGDLINLEILYLHRNNITGFIPQELGLLSKLKTITLDHNSLSGSIPYEIGDLVNLESISLSFNQITGNIPIEIGNIPNLIGVNFANNSLSGNLPTELNNISTLDYLILNSNNLSGGLQLTENSINNLININLDFNGLYSGNNEINTIINTICDCDWQSTQTTAPENLQIVAASNNSISLNWDQASYLQHGGYKILMADDVLGPFNVVNETVSKAVTAYTQGGLNSEQNYYFKLKTFTNPHEFNQNKVISDESDGVNDKTFSSADSADLWSTISYDNQQQISIGSFIEYKITVGNDGPNDAVDAGFRHNLPTGLSNGMWSCASLTGTAMCPSANGANNIDIPLNLPANSSLEFTLTAQVDSIDSSSLLITTSLTPPDGVSDTDLLSNVQFLNFEQIYANGFE